MTVHDVDVLRFGGQGVGRGHYTSTPGQGFTLGEARNGPDGSRIIFRDHRGVLHAFIGEGNHLASHISGGAAVQRIPLFLQPDGIAITVGGRVAHSGSFAVIREVLLTADETFDARPASPAVSLDLEFQHPDFVAGRDLSVSGVPVALTDQDGGITLGRWQRTPNATIEVGDANPLYVETERGDIVRFDQGAKSVADEISGGGRRVTHFSTRRPSVVALGTPLTYGNNHQTDVVTGALAIDVLHATPQQVAAYRPVLAASDTPYHRFEQLSATVDVGRTAGSVPALDLG